MENQKQTTKKGIKKSRSVNASIVILICLILAVLFFRYVLGNTSNFEDGNIDNHPLNLLGTMYKGETRYSYAGSQEGYHGSRHKRVAVETSELHSGYFGGWSRNGFEELERATKEKLLLT